MQLGNDFIFLSFISEQKLKIKYVIIFVFQ